MQKTSSNPTFLLMLSAAFEYYDFVIYGLMSTYLGPLFFPNNDILVSQLQAFAVFALGYIARPVGGVILGALGDLTSRKSVFIRSNIILALATITISLLPNYYQIGITATICIICLRLIQSFTFSAELPGAMSLIEDGKKQPSRRFSFIISGAAIGSILASSILYLLEYNYTKQEILNFAWRLPFIFGSILCVVGFLLRSKLPDFAHAKPKDRKSLFANLLPQYPNIIGSVLVISVAAYLIMMNLFFPTFIPKFYGYNVKEVYLAISLSLAWSVIYAPIFTYATSKFSKTGLIRICLFVGIFIGLVINFMLLRQGFTNLVIGLCLYQSIITSLLVLIFPLMSKIFPAEARFTLIALCYNLTYSVIAFSPILIVRLAERWQSPFSLWLGFILLSIFALANVNKIDDDSKVLLDRL
jgi:MFS family permease